MSSGFEAGSGLVSGPFGSVVPTDGTNEVAAEAVADESPLAEGEEEAVVAGAAGLPPPPIRTFSGSARSGNSASGTLGAYAASARINWVGGGHPHSSGTSVSTLSICPE